MVTTVTAAALAPLVRIWPEPVLLTTPAGDVVVASDGVAPLLRLERPVEAATSLATLLGDQAARALLGDEPRTAETAGADDGLPVGRPVVRARATRLPGGELLVRLEDASEEHRLRSRLELASRLASVGELLSSVAHELSNPLTTVLGYADLLLSDDDARIPRTEIERIRDEALRCRRIVGNLLDLARAEALELHPIAVTQIVEKVVEFRAYAALVSQIELVRETADDLPPVNGDRHRLVQAVLNLVTNAEDAVREREPPRRIVLRTRSTGRGVAIEVEDNGPGVPPAIRPFIFEPFFTTKPRGKGTGLGLSLVRACAQAHGGSIRVETAPSGGALFVLEIPCAPDA